MGLRMLCSPEVVIDRSRGEREGRTGGEREGGKERRGREKRKGRREQMREKSRKRRVDGTRAVRTEMRGTVPLE